MRSQRTNKKSKWKKGLLITGTLLIIILGAIGGYGLYLYHSVAATTSQMYSPLSGQKTGDLPLQKFTQHKTSTTPAINILLLGVDERKGDKGRSDTMIVATLNPTTQSMLLTSIPRDTRVHIPGRSGYSKINAAYAYGNENLAVQTVEKYLNIKIPYYVKVNMEGLKDLVDAVGGVTVNNDIQWYDGTDHFNFKKGELNLNGTLALAYSRMRHQDYRGDFGRNLRQREVIESIMSKGKSLTSVTKMHQILNVLGSNVTTNLSFSDMKQLAKNYRSCRENVAEYETQGTPKYIDGISWVLVSQSEFQNVHNKIENQLALK